MNNNNRTNVFGRKKRRKPVINKEINLVYWFLKIFPQIVENDYKNNHDNNYNGCNASDDVDDFIKNNYNSNNNDNDNSNSDNDNNNNNNNNNSLNNNDDNIKSLNKHINNNKKVIYSFIQNKGDTVFVPQGYQHAVLNLNTTVAITHNFVKTKDKNIFIDWIDKNKFSLDMDTADFIKVKELVNKNYT